MGGNLEGNIVSTSHRSWNTGMNEISGDRGVTSSYSENYATHGVPGSPKLGMELEQRTIAAPTNLQDMRGVFRVAAVVYATNPSTYVVQEVFPQQIYFGQVIGQQDGNERS